MLRRIGVRLPTSAQVKPPRTSTTTMVGPSGFTSLTSPSAATNAISSTKIGKGMMPIRASITRHHPLGQKPPGVERPAPVASCVAMAPSPSFRFCRQLIRLRDLIQTGDEFEPLAPEHHVRRISSEPGEVSPVRLAPVGQRAIAFALVMGEGRVDLVEPPLGQLDRPDDRSRNALPVERSEERRVGKEW